MQKYIILLFKIARGQLGCCITSLKVIPDY